MSYLKHNFDIISDVIIFIVILSAPGIIYLGNFYQGDRCSAISYFGIIFIFLYEIQEQCCVKVFNKNKKIKNLTLLKVLFMFKKRAPRAEA